MNNTDVKISSRNATVKVILFTSKTLANGDHPIMIKITKNRIRKHISIGLSCPLKYWDKAKELPKHNHPNRTEIIGLVNKFEKEFSDKIQEFSFRQKEYTIDQLVDVVLRNAKSMVVAEYIDHLVATLREEKRLGTASSNNDCKLMLFKFHANKNLTFQEIDYSFLIKWESYMRKNSFKETSMAVYFRTLRSIINKAIKEDVIPKSCYPFDQFKVSKFDLTTKKRALTKEEMMKIANYETKVGSKLYDCHNIFMFSYCNQGMNFIDIANLTWSQISKTDMMEYCRLKTGHNFSIQQNEYALKILNEYRKITGYDKNNFVFPILNKAIHKTDAQIENRLNKVIKQVNEKMKKIGAELDIETPITTYVARHSYATILQRSGVSGGIIKETMGHATEEITQTYLAGFGTDVFTEANKNLF
jgi:integrase